MEWKYIKEPKKKHLAKHPSWLVTNIAFCYEGEPLSKHTPMNLRVKENNRFCISISQTIIRRLTFPREASINTAKISAMRTALRGIHNTDNKG